MNSWFDKWGSLDYPDSDDPVLNIKVSETEILDSTLSAPAFRCLLYIRYIASNNLLNEYSRAKLARDLNVSVKTLNKWFNELDDTGKLRDFAGTWVYNEYPSHLYFIQAITGGPIKIGRAIDIDRRLAQFQTASPQPLTIIGIIENGGETEGAVHRLFGQHRLNGEWFREDPEILEFIDKSCKKIT